jgi:toxin YhaV
VKKAVDNVRNGWTLYHTTIFREQLAGLAAEVRALRESAPVEYRSHPRAKLLKSVRDAIFDRVPGNPAAPEFQQGNTLGGKYRHWRRVKQGLPQRYRLFFRFEEKRKIILYAWLNDETTLRKAGSKTDVYAIFAQKLSRGEVPDSIEELLRDAASSGE